MFVWVYVEDCWIFWDQGITSTPIPREGKSLMCDRLDVNSFIAVAIY